MALAKILVTGLLGAALLVAGAMAYVRLAPLPQSRLDARAGPMAAGEHINAGGIKLVLPLADLPPSAFDRLIGIISDTPRTTRLGSGPDHAVFVTRSALWGFPDIAVVWVQDDALHIHSALVYGAADLGVNAARVQRWIAALRD